MPKSQERSKASFWKPENCGQTVLPDSFNKTKIGQTCQKFKSATFQTVLPDRLFLKEQKWVEHANFQKFKWDILSNFQAMCRWS